MSKLKLCKKNKQCKKNTQDILRPRTAYNFFYRYQRDLILKSKVSSVAVNPDIESFCENKAMLSWDYGTAKKKRPHRKTHGLIGLQQLTKTVAKRWREADKKTKDTFIRLAQQDKIRYKHETISSQHSMISPPLSLPPVVQSYQHEYIPSMPQVEIPGYQRVESCIPEPVHSSNLMPTSVTTPPCNNTNSITTYTTDTNEPVAFMQESNTSSYMPYLTSQQTKEQQHCTFETILSNEEYDMLDLLIHI